MWTVSRVPTAERSYVTKVIVLINVSLRFGIFGTVIDHALKWL